MIHFVLQEPRLMAKNTVPIFFKNWGGGEEGMIYDSS